MDYINATRARKDLFNLIGAVNEGHTPLHISSPRGNVVFVKEFEQVFAKNAQGFARIIGKSLLRYEIVDKCALLGVTNA